MNELSNGIFEYINENGLKINGLSNINKSLSIHYIIYRIDNLIDGKYYIGQHQTKNPLDCYSGSGKTLILAQAKYGISSFYKTLLFDFNNFNDMNNKEIELIQLSNCYPYNPMSYNLIPGGKYSGTLSGELNPLYGISFTEDHKQKISKALTGIPKSEEHKKHISQARTGQPGTWTLLSDDKKKITAQKISESQKKITHTKEWNKNISIGLKNRTSEQKAETYQKFIHTLKNHTEEEKQIIWKNRSNASKGRKCSDKTKQILSCSNKKIWNDPIKKAQMLENRMKLMAKKSQYERDCINKAKGKGGKKSAFTQFLKKMKILLPNCDFTDFPFDEYCKISKDQKTSRKLFIEKWLQSKNIVVNLVQNLIRVTNGFKSILVDKHHIPDGYVPGMKIK